MFNYLKNFKIQVQNTKFYLYIIISIVTYSTITLASMDNIHLYNNPMNILGGFSLNQLPFSIYTLIWTIPKVILSYLLFIYIENLISSNFFMTIIRVKSKIKWYLINNLIGLITILFWYIAGYMSVALIMTINSNIVNNYLQTYINMILLDILFSYFIFNMSYMLAVVNKKLVLGVIISFIIYFSSIFINNPNSLLFKILPSNHAMILRQEYLSNSYLYLSILSIIFLFCGIYFFKHKEI